jgi:hypothetical protein
MKRNKHLIIFIIALGFIMLPVQAETYYVATDGNDQTGTGATDNPFLTINKAFIVAWLNDPASGDPTKDTIIVRRGTYHECVQAGLPWVNNSPVEIISEDWMDLTDNTQTIIDGSGVCDFSFSSFLRKATVHIGSSDSRLEGFTITGGGNSGVSARGSVVVTNNIITGNKSVRGGGVYVKTASIDFAGDISVQITNNVISENQAIWSIPPLQEYYVGGNGGGIYVYAVGIDPDSPGFFGDVSVTIDNNTITGNSIDESDTSFDNSTNVRGGGLAIFTDSSPGSVASVVMTNNLITSNSATTGTSAYGGGAWLYAYGYGTEMIEMSNNTIASNSVTLDGGGVSAWIWSYGTQAELNPFTTTDIHHNISLTDNTVTGNAADRSGGGFDLYLKSDTLMTTEMSNITVADNNLTNNAVNLISTSGTLGGAGIANLFINWRTDLPGLGIDLIRNSIKFNESNSHGGGVSAYVEADGDPPAESGSRILPAAHASSEMTIDGNMITNNTVTDQGGGMFTVLHAFADSAVRIDIKGSTMADNTSTTGTGGVYVESWNGYDLSGAETTATLAMQNSILVADTDQPNGVGIGGIAPGTDTTLFWEDTGNTGGFTLDMGYSDVYGFVQGNYDTWVSPDPTGSDGNISTDPELSANFYKPSTCSLTVDGADPALDASLEPAPNGSRANMGYYGGTSQATKSLADIDGDQRVDGIDVLRLATSFLSLTASPHYLINADLDGDGDVDGDDLSLLAADYGTTCVP